MITEKTLQRMRENELLEKFKKKVCERSSEIDPDNERDWFCLSYGFFLALCLDHDPEVAYKLANEANTLQYWMNCET